MSVKCVSTMYVCCVIPVPYSYHCTYSAGCNTFPLPIPHIVFQADTCVLTNRRPGQLTNQRPASLLMMMCGKVTTHKQSTRERIEWVNWSGDYYRPLSVTILVRDQPDMQGDLPDTRCAKGPIRYARGPAR